MLEYNVLNEIPVLDLGFVRLDSYMADDLSVVNSARVSFANRSSLDDDGELNSADKGLIYFLMREKHGTPFEHNAFRWHIKCPIFVAREWMRHRIGSFNEWSGRYSQLEPDFYIPENVRTQVGKPGSYVFEPVDEDIKRNTQQMITRTASDAYDTYEYLLERGVAKEVARLVLPLNIYTQFYWTVNARSLLNFLSLRSAETAQFEIRAYANQIEGVFHNVMPVTYNAFVDNGRRAP